MFIHSFYDITMMTQLRGLRKRLRALLSGPCTRDFESNLWERRDESGRFIELTVVVGGGGGPPDLMAKT